MIAEKKTLNYPQLRKLIMDDSKKKGILREVVFEITNLCNYNCQFCYVHDSCGTFMPIDRFCRLIDEARDMGCLWLTLTGGEPLMHPDFFRMLEYAARHIKQIVIFTNASLIDDNTAAKFKDHGVQVEVSLYGFNRESYESYVGITGAFRAFEKGLDLLKSYNVDCILKTSITNRNIQWLDRLKEYAYLKGCKYKFDPSTLIRMTLGNKKASKEERLSPSESASLLANDKNICKEVIRLIEQNSFNNDLYNCNGGITTCLISSDLHMSYCVAVREPYYDLHNNKSNLNEAHEWLMKQRIDKLMPNNKCFDCKYRPICRYCPGRFETETGSQRVPPQWNCDFGHILLSQALDNILKEKG